MDKIYLVDKQANESILSYIRHVCTLENLEKGKILRKQAIKVIQMLLLHFDFPDPIQEGRRLVEITIEPATLNEDFDGVDDLIDRLCQKRSTERVFNQIQKNQK
ncbi:unnamed protein product [Rotaria magnacalcarata]|uniref:Uncharacterized protein n=1 Tax=Rotaria magnacalcarata TaxID=392030 RepID=A0A816P4S8_9BILA|nr:unnamed protein product [Rotaria magnacalcarata]CAF2043996.1 unnamed protein product [Rotaria magnacalcarata]